MLNINDYWKIFEIVRRNGNDSEDTLTDIDSSEIIKTIAKSERANTTSFFEGRFDQNVFATEDYKRIRKFLIDWYSSHKSLITIQKKYSDPYSLTEDLLDEMFRSFGYNFSTNIVTKGSSINHNKINFLLDLVRLYRIKGTPESIINSLKYYGFTDIDLIEYFLIKHPITEKLTFESTIVASNGYTGTSLLKKYTPFNILTENDPHWYILEEDLLNSISVNKIALPSKSPYFSLRVSYFSDDMLTLISYLKRLTSDQYSNWILTGDLPEQDALISITGDKCSLLELYISSIYVMFSQYKNTSGYDPQDLFIIYDGTSVTSAEVEEQYQYFSSYYLSSINNFTSDSGNNQGNITFTVKEEIPDNTPESGFIDINLNTITLNPNRYRYLSWKNKTFYLDSVTPLYFNIPENSNMSVLCNPINTRKQRIIEFNNLFTRPKNQDYLQQKNDCETLLQQLNPTLKAKIDTILDITPSSKLISPFLKDLDNWIRINVSESFPKLSYHVYGADTILEDVGDVINFFKPFRSRLKSIEVINAFTNRLTESIPIEDNFKSFTIKEHTIEPVPVTDILVQSLNDIYADKLTCTNSSVDPENLTETFVYYGDINLNIGDLILFSFGGFVNFDEYGAKYDCTFANDVVQIQVNELGSNILSDTFSK